MNHPDRPFGDNQWFELSTVYTLDWARDQVKTIRGRDIADPVTEELYWSGLEFMLDLSWEDVEESWSYPAPSNQSYLLVA